MRLLTRVYGTYKSVC